MVMVLSATRVARRLIGRMGALGVLALLAACSGSTGAQGPAGATGATGPAGPSGPTGPVSALSVTKAAEITATITAVTVPTSGAVQPVVKFTLLDQNGQPLAGLPASDISFAIAKLVPPGTQLKAFPGLPAPTPQVSAQWQSYLYRMVDPAPASAGTATDPVVGALAEPQAITESGSSGTFHDNGDGTYQYTFAADISKDPVVTYDPTLPTRVGFEIRGLAPANSPVYTFMPSTGATTGFDDNAIVGDNTCLACHQKLAFHGGARTEVQYCVVCHNPSSVDPSSGNSLDFKIMIHKIHMGANLPTVLGEGVAQPTHYYIFGYQNSISDFSSIVFPTDPTGPDTCATCHNESDTATPDTSLWRTNPSIEACGSCHDNLNFRTGTNHSAADLGSLTDADCVTCHGPNATETVAAGGSGGPQEPIQVAAAHATLVWNYSISAAQISYQGILNYSKQFAYSVDTTRTDLTGQNPEVTFTVSDPTQSTHLWNILADAPFTGADCPTASIGMILGWSSTDYTNIGASPASEAQPARTAVTCNSAVTPVGNSDGSFTVTLPASATVPGGLKAAGVTGTAAVLIDGFPAHDFGDGQGPLELLVPSVVAFSPITDSTVVPRRNIVSVAKCDVCHDVLNAHGNHRVDNVQACALCHNPDATDIAAREADGITATNAATTALDGQVEEPIDLKYMIHALHDGNVRAADGAPYVVYHKVGSSVIVDDFRKITPFPGALNNCLGCHDPGTYYPQDPTSSTSLATTINSNGNSTSPAGEVAITPATAVCSSCHVDATARKHMTQNGGSFTAVKDATGQIVGGNQETCVVCHGPGAVADVAVVHDLSQYPQYSQSQ